MDGFQTNFICRDSFKIWSSQQILPRNCPDALSYIIYPILTLSLLAATFLSADNLCSLDPDWDQQKQNVGPDVVPNRLTL